MIQNNVRNGSKNIKNAKHAKKHGQTQQKTGTQNIKQMKNKKQHEPWGPRKAVDPKNENVKN